MSVIWWRRWLKAKHPTARTKGRTYRRPQQAYSPGAEQLEARNLLSLNFAPPVNFVTGAGPAYVVSADVNHDGKLDLITANTGNNNISVLLGNGNGGFLAQQVFPSVVRPTSLAVGDFRHNGILDIVVTGNDQFQAGIMLGNGNGTFKAVQNFSAGSGSYGVATGDFNGDGKLDVAVTDYSNNIVSVVLGQGDGTFQSQHSFAVNANPGRIVVGDFNHDGRLDLAVSNVGGNNVSVLLGNGDGLFQAQQTYGVGTQPRSIAAGDLNHDGNLDLVVGNRLNNSVSVLLGNSNGTFQAQQSFFAGTGPTGVTLADFDGDGKIDIATSNYNSNNVTVMLGNGNGQFQSPRPFAASSAPMGITAADLNRDGAPDLIVANFGANNVSVLLNLPPSPHALFFGSNTTFTTGISPVAEATGDFNHDGNPDVVTANRDGNTVSVLLGNGNGTFQNKFILPTGVQPVAIVTSDVNGDGNLDFVVANSESNSVSVILGNGDGTFKTQSVFPVGNHPDAVTLGDFNGDGKMDLAVANALDNTVSLLLGNGDGSLQNQRTFTVGPEPSSLVAGDFNGDSKIDLAVTNFGFTNYYGVSSVSLLLGNGNGTFLDQTTTFVGANPRSIIAADFDQDRKLDLAFVAQNDNEVSVMLGNGNGTFLPIQSFVTGAVPTSVVTGDVDGDGILDLAVTNVAANTESILLGTGGGFFGPQQTFPTGVSPFAAVLGYFNSDRNLDVAVANGSSNTVSVLLGNGNGAFQFHQSFTTGVNPNGVAVGDLNNDSKIDVAVANTASNTVGILLGNADGTLQTQQIAAVGAGPTAIVLGNFNGLIGIAVANSLGNSVSVITTNNVFKIPFQVQSFAVGNNPRAIAVGDVNNDGKMDLAVANYGDNTVSVLLGNGDGTFQAQQTFGVGTQPDGIVIADFNGDTFKDIATANYGGNNVSVLLSNGNGTFKAATAFAVGSRPSSLVVEDFNGDFSNDLITTNIGSNTISVLLGKPDGTFLPQLSFVTGASPAALAVGDYNKDDILDVAVTNLSGNTVSVLLGNGNGTFKGQQTYATALGAYAIGTADFNNDTNLDFGVSNPSSDTVTVILGNGNGTFQNQLTLAAGAGSFSSVSGDFNKDGKQDFAVTNPLNNTVSVLLGNGDGSFQTPVVYATGSLPKSVFAADVNGDSNVDLIVTNEADNTVGVLLGNGNGTFQKQSTSATQLEPLSVAVGDFNGDKNMDLVVTNAISNTVSVLLGNGNGTFLNQQPYNVGIGPYGVAVGDFNGDKVLDLAVTNVAGNSISVLLGNADGTFKAQQTFGAGIKPKAIALGDFNGDKVLDIAVANYGSSTASVLLGNGNGTFQAQEPLITGVGPSSLAIADFNGDTKSDLAVANYGSNTVSFFFGNGNGSFANPLQVQTGAGPLSLLTDKFFGTAANDLISLHNGANLLTVMRGNGNGTFQVQQSYATGQQPSSVVLGDFNNDGKLDIATANDRTISVSVFMGNGNGLIRNQATFATSGAADSIVIGDFNSDGRLDLAVNNADNNLIGVFLGNGDGTFQAQRVFATPGSGPGRLVVGDFNNDGRLDLAVLRTSSNLIGLLLGDGAGNFTVAATPPIAVPVGTQSLATGDFNNDGRLDLVSTTSTAIVNVLLGNANGTFQSQQFTLLGSLRDATVADFNRDGKQDLAVVGTGPDLAYILPGNGDGTFGLAQLFLTQVVPDAVSSADFNGDGTLDLAVTNFASNTVSVLPGNGDATFQNQQTFIAGTGPVALAVGDLSNDGTPDIVAANKLSNNVAVLLNNPQAVHFDLVAPATITAGAPFSLTVIAQDAGLNTAVGYTGTITFSSSDPLAALPGSYTFTAADKGVHTFQITLGRAGSQTVTVTDANNAGLVGVRAINVTPGVARSYAVSAPNGALASTPFSVAVTAFDIFGNTAVGYAGTVHFTSSDPAATLPADYTFTAADQGVHTFTNGVTLRSIGAQTIAARDTINASVTGSATVNVAAATGDHFSLGAPTSVRTSQFFSVTVTALNSNNQTDIGYRGTIHFTTTDSLGTVPPDYTFTAADNGVHTFNNLQLLSLGVQTISATDKLNSQVKGATAVTVNPITTTHFNVSLPASTTAGGSFSFTVTALTATGQVDTKYGGTIHFTSSDTSAGVVLPPDYTFTIPDTGVHTFTATLDKAGAQTVTVLDTSLPQVSGTGSITVTPATASQLQVVAINLDSDPVKVGNAPTSNVFANFPFTLQVSATDAFGNLATGYTDTIHFTSTDNGAGVVLPADYKFTAADQGVHLFPLGATLKTVGARTITATDTSNNAITGQVGLSVALAPRDVIVTSVPQPPTVAANTPFNITVTVFRPDHTVDNTYTGTIHFTTSDPDPRVTLPADYTFTAGDAGTHSFSNGAILATAGFEKVTAHDLSPTQAIQLSGFLTVTPGAPTHFGISAPTTSQAGQPFSLRVTALDAFNNIVTGYTGTITFTTTDPALDEFLPANYTFTAADAGVHTFINNNAPILITEGVQRITANDVANPQLVSTVPIQITAAPASFFTFTTPATVDARFPFTVTVTARDPFSNIVTNYAGTVTFRSTDPLAVLPVNYTFQPGDQGVHTFVNGFTLQTLGTQTLKVHDANSTYSIQGSATIPVNPETQDTFILQAPPVVNTTVPFSFTVTAIAPNGTVDTNFGGTVFFSTTNPGATLPGPYTFQPSDNGTHTFVRGINGATFVNGTSNPRNDTLTVTNGLRSTTTRITVNPAPTDTLVVSGPVTSVTGQPFDLQVTVLTPAGNLDPNYVGTVHFTSSDPAAVLPADYTFTASDAGMHSFNGLTTLNTPGPKVITVRDTASGTIVGTVTVINTPAPTDTFRLTYPAGTIVGAPLTVTVTALRPNGTVDTGYTGTVHFTSSDALATLPLDYSFQPAENGVHTFTNGIILRSLGSQTVTATDTSKLPVEGTTSVTVVAASNDLLGISMPVNVVAGQPFTFTVTAFDAFHNVDAGYTGTVHFSTSDPSGSVVLPIDYIFTPADRGTHAFTLGGKLITAGPQSVIATDTVNGAITGSFQTTVLPGVAAKFAFAAPVTITSGTPFTGTLTVLDQFNNINSVYVGTVHFTSNDATAVLPGDYTFTTVDKGVHVFTDQFTLNAVNAAATITATDTLQGSVNGTATVAVTPQAVDGMTLLVTRPDGSVVTTASAGSSYDLIVTVLAPGGTVDTGYTGTVHFTSTDPAASLPLDYTFTATDQGVHRFVNGVTLQTQGFQVVTVTDTANAATKARANVTVGPAATDVLTVAVPAQLAVGQPFNITVTAINNGKQDFGYVGTIHFTSSVPGGVVPPDYTFVPLDRGQHTFVNGGLFTKAGTQTVTATDTVASTITGTGVINMIPAAANHFGVTAPTSTSAGAPFSVTVAALDPFNNVVTNFSDKVLFSSTDQAATLPVNYAFTSADQGVHTFASGVSLNTVGPQSITVTDTVNSSVQGSATVNVNQGTNDLFTVSAPGSTPAGSPFTVTVTVLDANGNVDTSYTGTVHFSSSDPNAILPADYAFTAADLGRHTFSGQFVLSAAGSQTITATDTINPLIKGSAPVTVNLAQSDLLSIAAPASSVSGVPFSITVSALDPFLNVDPTYTGRIHFTSSDPAATLPADYTFVAADGGVRTFSGVTLTAIGRVSITATDMANSKITGSAFVQDNPVQADHFSVAAPGNAAPGVPFTVVVTARGTQGTTATSYIGTVHFTSSDVAAGLPADYTFTVLDRGTHSFPGAVTLNTVGNQTVTATDTKTASITGTSSPVLVQPGAADHFTFTAPVNVTANTPFSITINAVDSGGNPFPGYRGTVHFTSDDTAAVLPGDYLFTASDNGSHTFTGVKLGTIGSHTVTVQDVFTPSVKAVIPIQVSNVAVDHFGFTGAPSSVLAGQPFSLTISAQDSANATVVGYRGTIHFASTDANAVLPANYTFTAADNGSHTFTGLALKTAGPQNVNVNDTTTPAVQGGVLIQVNPILATHFALSMPATASAGAAFSVTVTALDASNNPVVGYTGTVHFTTSDGASGVVLPADYTFVAGDQGIHTFANGVTLRTPGTQFVTVLDTAAPNVTGTASIGINSNVLQQNIIVTSADAGGGPNVIVFDSATKAVKFNFMAYDINYTGGVRVAVGDVNGDGIPDIITAPGKGGGPDIHIYDGRTGGLIRQFFAYDMNFTGGSYVSSADINGDGFADVICGADSGGGPNITVFSGKDGSRLSSFFAYDMNFTGGVRVAAGDVDGDGRADIIAGAGAGGGPNITVFSGADGHLIKSFFAFNQNFTAGIYVAAGDVNGDGHADLIVGAGAGGGPNVSVFSGLDFSGLYSVFPFDPRFTGGVRVGAVDTLGNGRVNLLAVPGQGGGPDVVTLGGLTPVVLDEFFAYDPLFTGGLYVAGSAH